MQTVIKNKGIIGIILAVVLLITAAAGAYTPRQNTYAAEDYHSWSQLDPRWGSTPIGGSTVARAGCYITSIAMVAVASGARDTETFNPGTFASDLNSIGAFNWGGALISWSSVNAVIPEVKIETANLYFSSSSRSDKAATMKSWLDQGYYVICNVGGHWVFVEGIIGDDVYMVDPAKDDVMMFESYNNSNISCYQVLSGKNPYSDFNSIKYETGEYYYSGEKTAIYDGSSDESEIISALGGGFIVNVLDVENGYGRIVVDGESVYVNMAVMTLAADDIHPAKGDINSDGKKDMLDIALVNEYLSSINNLPDGVSILRECEIEAADMNDDGIVDNTDVLMLLTLVCG